MNVVLQGAALVLLGIILFFYVSQRRVQLNTEKAYMNIWIFCVLDASFDMLLTILLMHMSEVPYWLVHVVLKLYLITIMWVPIMALVYVLADIYELTADQKVRNRLFYIIGLGVSIIILSLPAVIYQDAATGNYHAKGIAVVFTWLFNFLVYIYMAFITWKNRESIEGKRREAIALWLAVWTVATVLQLMNPDLKVTSFAAALGVTIIYIKMENPESNIDRNSGMFNSHAML